jgi:hypothetical protein
MTPIALSLALLRRCDYVAAGVETRSRDARFDKLAIGSREWYTRAAK